MAINMQRPVTDFWFAPPASLYEALRMHEDPVGLVRQLLNAAGELRVEAVPEGDGWRFRSSPGTRPLDLLLLHDGVLTGTSAERVERVYHVVRAIETELSDGALYGRSQFRAARLENLRVEAGMDWAELNWVLRNWSKFLHTIDGE